MPKPLKKHKKENLLLSLGFNVVLPIVILSKLTTTLGPMKTLFVALLFPASYAIIDYILRRQFNPISLFGFCGTLLKGTFAFFHVNNFWFAVQEAILPTFIGIFVILSAYLGKPIGNYFFYNESVFHTEKLEDRINTNQKQREFQRSLWIMTLLFGGVFLFGGVMSFLLARMIIVSPVGTTPFNLELAHMTFLGYLVIATPKLIMSLVGIVWFVKKIKGMTGLGMEDIFRG